VATTVLLIDDHPIVRFGVSTILRRARDLDVTVIAVPSVSEAIKQTKGARVFDLVILDLNLPDASGTESISVIRQHLPATPILVLSACEDADTIRRSLEEGANGFVMKSQGPDALMSAIPLVLSGGRYLPSPSAMGVVPPVAPATPLSGLTARQREIHSLLATGRSNKEIATELGLALGTVKNHVSHILQRLNRQRRGQVIADDRVRQGTDEA
jgi:DNA-binding NarL/FixJ family response regulator